MLVTNVAMLGHHMGVLCHVIAHKRVPRATNRMAFGLSMQMCPQTHSKLAHALHVAVLRLKCWLAHNAKQ